eukprot:CAMPEP_0198291130 /NCGR_PEP_ID=MMETSP1449-20131203/8763_1 /TAXON_ID=420275 /ORGANISM="Attheya septentrionalis, Strain CCMP2084" /LENGTH=484 /DNA_ID=CAMNT_0043989733 /DNA_START=322 /DNA_END=1776 /DNA_ORIENTATION=-
MRTFSFILIRIISHWLPCSEAFSIDTVKPVVLNQEGGSVKRDLSDNSSHQIRYTTVDKDSTDVMLTISVLPIPSFELQFEIPAESSDSSDLQALLEQLKPITAKHLIISFKDFLDGNSKFENTFHSIELYSSIHSFEFRETGNLRRYMKDARVTYTGYAYFHLIEPRSRNVDEDTVSAMVSLAFNTDGEEKYVQALEDTLDSKSGSIELLRSQTGIDIYGSEGIGSPDGLSGNNVSSSSSFGALLGALVFLVFSTLAVLGASLVYYKGGKRTRDKSEDKSDNEETGSERSFESKSGEIIGMHVKGDDDMFTDEPASITSRKFLDPLPECNLEQRHNLHRSKLRGPSKQKRSNRRRKPPIGSLRSLDSIPEVEQSDSNCDESTDEDEAGVELSTENRQSDHSTFGSPRDVSNLSFLQLQSSGNVTCHTSPTEKYEVERELAEETENSISNLFAAMSAQRNSRLSQVSGVEEAAGESSSEIPSTVA